MSLNNIKIEPDKGQCLAAVDLGSNSFHLIITRISDDGSIQVIDKIKEMVRLGEGLDDKNNISECVQQRALDCLQRFGERLQDIKSQNVRIVGTNTLRVAKNSKQFLKQAQKCLGHSIEIISGIEEARLIYLGVSHSIATNSHKRLVVDIGGGSTEFIIGKKFSPKKLESLYMGCVSMTRRFFSDGIINKKQLKKAEIVAGLELERISYNFKKTGWDHAVGASGSIRSISSVLNKQGLIDNGKITLRALKNLRKLLIDSKHINKLELNGLSEERKPVFVGGFVVLFALFKALDINEMEVSDGAVREGLIYDLLGRIKHEDVREATINRFMERYSIQTEHVQNVADTALFIFSKVSAKWSLNLNDYANVLRWAALLHEIGLTVAHAGYHKHGAYLAQNSDMPGFSLQAQQILAILIRSHRQKFPNQCFINLPEQHSLQAKYLSIILRIAVILHRNREKVTIPNLEITAEKSSLKINFPESWLDDHSLIHADLKREKNFLKEVGFKLKID